MKKIKVIDSHTGGEPTRIIIDGGPDVGDGPMGERRSLFKQKHDSIRTAVVNEPRGGDVLVGGLLCEATDPNSSAGVIFFDTAGFLGMCGHGTIGLMVTLKHIGRIELGQHQIETPVGPITATLLTPNRVQVQNVASYRTQADVTVDVPDYGTVTGDVVWGGNWFFCVEETKEQLHLSNVDRLLNVTRRIRQALADQNITGTDGAAIDHLELYGPPTTTNADSKNFVLCPSGTYDRSPCGTGTSAKMACLAADGKLKPGEVWRQESIVGSIFECSIEPAADDSPFQKFIPTITGEAHISGETELLLDPNDPFVNGICKEAFA